MFQINSERRGCLLCWVFLLAAPHLGRLGRVTHITVVVEPLGSQPLNPHALSFCAQFIPESARFNVSTGNTQAALATLQRIAKMNRSVMPEGTLVEPILVSSQLGGLLPRPEVPSSWQGRGGTPLRSSPALEGRGKRAE